MDLNHLTDDKRLITERAVLMARAVKQAGDHAHGKGLACLERAVMEHGQDLLRLTLEKTIGARDEAQ
jgi:hypothetical protein